MDFSAPIAKALVPKLPLIVKTVLAHSLSLTGTSSEWDVKTALTIAVLRSFMANPRPITVTKEQKISMRTPPIKGPMWVPKVTLPNPEGSDILEVLFKAIDGLCEGGETFTKPDVRAVEAEWMGYRAGVGANAPELSISDDEKYMHMMSEVKSDLTVMYLHGGAYYMLDPATHRLVTSKLAKLSKGRCFVVRYRLAPQHPFPAGLLDVLVAFMSLLYPPPGSLHAAVPASNICVSGDSAGGGLSMALLQTILELRRQSPDGRAKVQWYGEERELPIPAGFAINSGWFDLSRCMESLTTNLKYDYLPNISKQSTERYTPDESWPAKPPRHDFYANDDALCHPLISLVAAKDWRGSPPIFFITGSECLTDEDKFVAQQLVNQDVPLVFEQYLAMPHCFALILDGHAGAQKCLESWTKYMMAAVIDPASIKTSATEIAAKTLKERALDPKTLSPLTMEELRPRMKQSMERMLKGRFTDPTPKL